MKTQPELLLYADSETDADMLYFGGVFVPDAFIALTIGGRKVAVVSQLEYGRIRRESKFDEVLSLETYVQEAYKKYGPAANRPESVIATLAKKNRIKSFRVSETFPHGLATRLQSLGVRLEISDGMIFPERELKSAEEAEMIRQGNDASSAGFRVAEKLLRQSEIRRGYLYHNGKRLTSEKVQEAIAIACLERGAVAANTIVAGGDQACDPHCRGSGPLKADQFIIIDIFPRVSATGFHGDMTRTYLKGRANEEQKRLYETVFNAEQFALDEHRAGKSASKIYQTVIKGFTDKGYVTGIQNGVPMGFFHGLGHGLGLAVHEPPRVNASGTRLKKGQVITVEPGLYYPGLGGVRVEDVVLIQRGAPELLSRHPYRWHLR